MRIPKSFPARWFAAAASLLSVGAAPMLPVPPQADARVAAVHVRVSPDHPDWTYRLGEVARFRITVVADEAEIVGAVVSYTVGPEMMPGEVRKAEVPAGGVVIEGGSMDRAGFLRCCAEVEFGGRRSKGVATAAFAPEKIVPTQVEPGDFDAFWQAQKARLAGVPMGSQRTFLPESSTDAVNVHQVSIATVSGPEGHGYAARVYGILCEPKKPGRYPALLKLPGAHIRPYYGEKELAARGIITLEIGVTGIPVNLSKDVYDMLDAGALNSYWLMNLDDRENYYYNRVILGCLRANDFLTGLENWDGENLVVMGASQGGMLAIATAALDSRVTALAVTHPAFCDLTGDLHGRAGGWPAPFKPDFSNDRTSIHATPVKIAVSSYYDTVNFARRLKVPGYYTWGYNDDVCPPTSMHAAYNVISAPKELGLTLELAHSYTAEQSEAINRWIDRFLSGRKRNSKN